ncbi:hypothetical protein [Bifidobacterium scardovii]|uniref:Tail terminator n=1 Tax=Bifidobacterium scardovii TaxID=158787 RepID=A0A087DI34_9BIFI|nr:hypothetical protein [Bifidobacterium scardovii]KFI95184.1 hypothetical protein BSCA_1002 [Bifidobacterium scardovii]MDK6348736.1 hypothetical protein [Bifidobacterium scardovii]MDU8981287.1 hypothetical protein [Bifidobacterium scardovii]BAQ31572.1 hypothetical protein BBSC_1492 [Bifidobacterium scardovii JCM 12489 = DSM 13734]
MAMPITGGFPSATRLLRTWIEEHTGRPVWTRLPDNMSALLPLIMVSPAPSGGIDGYERQSSLDIDVYVTGPDQMEPLVRELEDSLASLQGDGNRYGYADSCGLTGFSEIPGRDPSVLRWTATATLTMRPQ